MEEQIEHYRRKLAYEMDSWDLFEALEAGERVVAVDARKPEAYAKRHIPGAVNLPHREIGAQTLELLDPETLYVVYCDGIGCTASTKGALKLAELGVRVRELIGGLDWWVRDGYATEGCEGTPGRGISCGC